SPIMSAVGRLHTKGSTRRMRIAHPKPAPPRMSSIAYGPPDTMKKVAAMSGSRRIFRGALLRRAGMIVNLSRMEAGNKRDRDRGTRERRNTERGGQEWRR